MAKSRWRITFASLVVCVFAVVGQAQVGEAKRATAFPEKQLLSLTRPPQVVGIYCAAIAPDARVIAYSHILSEDRKFHRAVTVWDLRKGKIKYVLKGHGNIVTALGFSKDGKTLACACDAPT